MHIEIDLIYGKKNEHNQGNWIGPVFFLQNIVDDEELDSTVGYKI